MSLDRPPRDWGFWTEVKLDTLERYLDRFTTTTKNKASSRIYLDLFAGQVDNVRRDDSNRHFHGSTVRALETDSPPFDRLLFFELPAEADTLESDLERSFPDDQDRYAIIRGDCNETIREALADLRIANLHWAPTFVFIDPNTLEIKWSTLSALSRFKHPKAKTKAEMWILLSHSTIWRLAGYDQSLGLDEEYSRAATLLYGSDVWREIHTRRRSDEIAASEARRLYVSLFRVKLQEKLSYKRTLSIEMGNHQGSPIYTMVFATDSSPGVRIMSAVYQEARDQAAEYRGEVRERRDRERRLKEGRPNLFDNLDTSPSERPIYSESIQDEEFPILPGWLRHEL